MKKIYITPCVKTHETALVRMIAASILSNRGIDYGGVDASGELDPAAKRRAIEDEMFEEEIATMNQRDAWEEGIW